jgi:hypothetical protein
MCWGDPLHTACLTDVAGSLPRGWRARGWQVASSSGDAMKDALFGGWGDDGDTKPPSRPRSAAGSGSLSQRSAPVGSDDEPPSRAPSVEGGAGEGKPPMLPLLSAPSSTEGAATRHGTGGAGSGGRGGGVGAGGAGSGVGGGGRLEAGGGHKNLGGGPRGDAGERDLLPRRSLIAVAGGGGEEALGNSGVFVRGVGAGPADQGV